MTITVPLFVPQTTNDASVKEASKTLLMTNHGWGKTTTCKYYQEYYGKGLILSGESGLKSLTDVEIPYIHFSSYDGDHNPENQVYSFLGIMKMVANPEFKKMGFKWICVDSLTELGDLILAEMETKHATNKNRFDKWTDFSSAIIGACKWIRDLPMHVLVTCLAGEEIDQNGVVSYWPLIPTQKTPRKILGLFDYVFCGEKKTLMDQAGKPVINPDTGRPVTTRYVIADEFNGWSGKARDPKRRLSCIQKEDNIVNLLRIIDMTDQEYEDYKQSQKAKPQPQQV